MVGNWKMNKTPEEAVQLVKELKPLVAGIEAVEIGVCPPFVCLTEVNKLLKGTNIGLGAQNMYWEPEGAYTGEISAEMLLTSGCRYVILGHSERRTYFGETNATVHRKLEAALQSRLCPIVCVGETREQREAGKAEKIRALLQFMYESGARILEILRVRIKDVDIENRYAVVGGGKRLVALPKTGHIEEWVRRHPMRKKPDAYLFCSSRDPKKPMRYQSVRKILNNLSKGAGLKRKITPHMFRHTRASILAKAGISPYAMNKIMGWSTNSKMWRTYLHITQKDAICEVLRKIE